MNVESLISTVQSQIDLANTEYTKEQILSLVTSVSLLTEDRIISVPTIDDLPDAANVANGFMAFVEDIKLPLFAKKDDGWYGIDGRKARDDRGFVAGQLWIWGRNAYGVVGDGTTADRSSPVTVAGGGINWCQASKSVFLGLGSAAIKTDGTLWTWGRNYYGSLGQGTGDYLDSKSSPTTTIGGGTDWSQVTVNGRLMYALKKDTSLWSWGSNCEAMLADGTTADRSSPGTTIYGNNWCFIDSSGQVIRAPIAGIKTDGTLWTWGRNYYGYLGDGTTSDRSSPGTTAGGGTNWCHVSAGSSLAEVAMSAIKTDGTLWTWGSNKYGYLGDGTTSDRSSPVTTAGGGTNWCYSTTGSYSMAAIKTDGTLWTWGCGGGGRLGDGTVNCRSSPGTTADGGTNWCQVEGASGLSSFTGLKTDGTLWTWGTGACGDLGAEEIQARSSPGTTAGGGTNWISLFNNGVGGIRSV